MATHRSINRTTVLSFVLCIFILLGAVSMVQAKTFRFTCQNVNAMEHPGWQVIARMAEDLKLMSQGQILIDQVGPGGLVKSPQTFEATGSGAIDMAITYGAYHGGIVPVAATSFALPGDPRDMWETLNFYYEEGGWIFCGPSMPNTGYIMPGPWSGPVTVCSPEKKWKAWKTSEISKFEPPVPWPPCCTAWGSPPRLFPLPRFTWPCPGGH